MKKGIIILMILSLFLLNGCSFTLKDPVDLIAPPTPGGELSGLKEALQANVGRNIILKTPTSGEYRSAYTLFDIDNNGKNEAIVFYKIDSNTSDLKMGILHQNHNKWEFVKEFTGLGHDIIEIIFEDLNNSGLNEIVVKSDSSESVDDIFSLFSYEKEAVEQIYTRAYTLVELFDVDNDFIKEILFFNHNINDYTSVATLFELSELKTINYMGNANLDGSIKSYSSAKIDDNGYVYLDSIESSQNNMITEVLVYNNARKLFAPITSTENVIGLSSTTSRKQSIPSTDVNGDKIIEIPTMKVMFGQKENNSKDVNYLTVWNQLEFDKYNIPFFVPKLTGAINNSDSYMFVFPEKWIDNVTLEIDDEEKSWVFRVWDNEKNVLGEKILGIIAMSKTQWDKQEIEGYSLLKENGSNVYAVKYYEYSDYTISLEQLEENLIILN